MADKPILKLDRDGAIAVVTLNRPDTLNALNPPLMRQLVETLRQVAEDETVRCVVLTGAGKGFCSGGDVQAMRDASKARENDPESSDAKRSDGKKITTEERARWLRRSAEASRLLHEMPKPTIAMINGACAGAGLSLAAACDFRYAGESAVFRPSFLAAGVSGDYGGSWLWTRILGPSKARQLYFFDEKRDAATAYEFGLVNDCFPDADLRQEVMDRATRLAAIPGAGVAYAKVNLNSAMDETFASHLDRESLGMMLSRNVLVEARRRMKSEQREADDGHDPIARAMATKEVR